MITIIAEFIMIYVRNKSIGQRTYWIIVAFLYPTGFFSTLPA